MRKKKIVIVLWRSEDGVVHHLKLTKSDIKLLKPGTRKKLGSVSAPDPAKFDREAVINALTELSIALDKFLGTVSAKTRRNTRKEGR